MERASRHRSNRVVIGIALISVLRFGGNAWRTLFSVLRRESSRLFRDFKEKPARLPAQQAGQPAPRLYFFTSGSIILVNVSGFDESRSRCGYRSPPRYSMR